MEAWGFRISEPVLIDDQTAMAPDVAVDDSDAAWVVWERRGRAGDGICACRYDTHGCGPILEVSAAPGITLQPCVVAHADGSVRITWITYQDEQWHLVTRVLRDGMTGALTILTSHTGGLFHPRMALGLDGTCWTVCEKVSGRQTRLVAFHLAEGGWSGPLPLATAEGSCYRPDLALGPDEGLWMVYDAYHDGHYQVFLQRIDQTGKPLTVTENGYQNLQATVATDPNGHLWIAWASNQNEAFRDRWWLTKWTYLRHFNGVDFRDPVGPPPDKDLYNEHAFQGWEFPAVAVDVNGRVSVFGQAAHTLYAQQYTGNGWSPRYTIAPRHWGSWKPRTRVAGSETLFVVSMGLQGAQLQQVAPSSVAAGPVVITPREPLPAAVKPLPRRETPTLTTADGQQLKVFFGDLHAHSVYSDAVGDVDEFYHRYRDAYGYDFAALTDHDYLDGIELSASELKMIWNHADRMTKQGRFVAFYGYEWTSPAIADHAGPDAAVGEGHRHILYPDQTGPLISYGEPTAKTGKQLLERLQGTRALVIPHHTAWSGTDWDAHDDERQRLVEVCSTHGRFEYPGNQPIGYRRDHLHAGKFVVDALARGYRLGFVGGSDSHGLRWHAIELEGRAAHIAPGTRVGWKEDAYRTGMTAILAPELTREALFDALYHRRCYATSGVPIVVDFRINGHLMGTEIITEGPPHLTVSVQGTSALRAVDIIRSGHPFAGVQAQPGEGLTALSAAFDDTLIIPGESHYYYARITQEDGNMAWSSPIWVRYGNVKRKT